MQIQDLHNTLRRALAEDIGAGDHTTLATLPDNRKAQARALIKADGVLAGVFVAEQVLRLLEPRITFDVLINDGSRVQKGDIAFIVSGSVHTLLSGERLMLNLLQRMSGIATATRKVVDAIGNLPCKVLDTRKTVPLLRAFDKQAVVLGGGVNHRFGLYDMILIKDNHVDAAGGIRQALLATDKYQQEHKLFLPVEIETRNLDEVQQVLDTGSVTRILLDNMKPDMLRQAVHLVGGRYDTEASGNIGLHNAREIAETGVDFLSMGALTHSVEALDISFKIA